MRMICNFKLPEHHTQHKCRFLHRKLLAYTSPLPIAKWLVSVMWNLAWVRKSFRDKGFRILSPYLCISMELGDDHIDALPFFHRIFTGEQGILFGI
ncbi:hypothetical protein D3C73_942390 [compost metagenome]